MIAAKSSLLYFLIYQRTIFYKGLVVANSFFGLIFLLLCVSKCLKQVAIAATLHTIIEPTQFFVPPWCDVILFSQVLLLESFGRGLMICKFYCHKLFFWAIQK